MATIDAFQGAEGSAEAQRRALLSAVAQQGSAGKQAVQEAGQAAQALRSASVSGAAQRAGVAGAPAGMAGMLAGIGGGSAAAYGASSQGAQRMLAADAQRSAAANSTYMDQVGAAIPVLRTLAESRQNDMLREAKDRQWEEANARKWALQDRQAQREDDALKRQWLLEDRKYEMEQRAAEAAGLAGGGGGLAALVKRLGGSDLAKPQLRALAEQAIARASAEGPKGKRPDGFTLSNGRTFGKADTLERYSTFLGDARSAEGRAGIVANLNRSLGLSAGELEAYLGDHNPAPMPSGEYEEASAETIDRIRNKPEYHEEIDKAQQQLSDLIEEEGLTVGEARNRIIAGIRKDPWFNRRPRLRDQVIEDF